MSKVKVATVFGISSLLIDQITKWALINRLLLHESVPILDNIIRLTHVRNPMAAWGLPISGTLSLIILPAVIGVVILLYQFRAETLTERIALSMVLGGAVGNFIDRVRWGNVVDFIDIGIRDHRWPVFNMADVFVTIGMFLVVYALVKKRR